MFTYDNRRRIYLGARVHDLYLQLVHNFFTYRIEFQIKQSPYLADFTETSSPTVTEISSPRPAEVGRQQSPNSVANSQQ
jgi:hypothetical protein